MEPVYRAAPPFPFLSGDFDAHGHTEGCEVVEAVHRDGGFGFLVWQSAGFQVWTDQGFGAVDGGLGEASAVVVGFDLPGFAADFVDPPDDRTAGRGRVLNAGRWGDRRPLPWWDDRARTLGKNGPMASEAVVAET